MAPLDVRGHAFEKIEQVEVGARVEVGRGDGGSGMEHGDYCHAESTRWKVIPHLVCNVDYLAFRACAELKVHLVGLFYA